MSVSLLEVIEAAGYNLENREDCIWLLSKQSEFEELIETVNERLEDDPELQSARYEAYRDSLREDGII